MQLDEKKIQFAKIGIGLWEVTGPNCEEVKRSILYTRSKPMGWNTHTFKFLYLCSEKHKYKFQCFISFCRYEGSFCTFSWLITLLGQIHFILLAHNWINSKYYKLMNFFKIWLKKNKNKWTMELCMWWVEFGVFFNPIDLLGLRNLQPLVALKTTPCKVWIW